MRKLTFDEAKHILYDVHILMQTQVDQTYPFDKAQKVWKHLIKAHPLLLCHGVQKNEDWFFEKAKEMPQILEVNQDPEAFIHELINTATDLNFWAQGYWVNHPKGSILITATHHSLSDAISLLEFHKEFFKGLEELIENKPLSSLPSYSLPRPLSALLPNEYTKKDPQMLLEKHFDPSKNLKASYLPNKFNPNEKQKTHRLKSHLLPDVFLGLKNQTKAHQVSLNSLLCAQLVQTAYPYIEKDQKSIVLEHDVPINVRRYFDPPISPHIIATYLAGFTSQVEMSEKESIWEIAHQIQKTTLEKTKPSFVFDMIRACTALKLPKKTDSLHPEVFLYTSNLGRVDFDLKKGKVIDFSFHAYCPVPFLVTFSTLENTLTICFVFTTPYVNVNWVEKFAKEYIAALKKLALTHSK